MRDLIVYIAIGLVIAVGGVLYGVYTAKLRLDPHLPLGWIGLTLITAVIFGYVGRLYRADWKRPRFLVTMALCLAAHLIVWLLIVVTLANKALPILGLSSAPEYIVITVLLNWVLRPQTAGRG